eukprot:CAMPEP_0172779136 /NCGR_PEP_ID=MMETSP1074-20121228/202267_1 /TAXON_ID=2916 /ORGANISM="Ceratium fusus, Strain PA161109" /LENGTH=252 /DNA_ID=CAMNT_0013616091 /DNA_START=139 /DNA_END=895 /DNA_ORIENTATION=-
MLAHSKAANRASIAHEATTSGAALVACREDDARSTSASSGHEDADGDSHAVSSDEERETALKQSEVVQHWNVPEDDARSTSASSGHEDADGDIHAVSSDEERETALKQLEVVQHWNVLASAPWRTGKQEQHRRQRQKQQKQCNDAPSKKGQLCAPPGLPPPATTVGGKAAPAALLGPAFSPPPGLPPPPGLIEPPPGLRFPEVKPLVVAISNCKQGAPAAFEYTPQAFRRELANIMRELRLHKNPGLAVGQV